MPAADQGAGPLAGLKVIDLGSVFAGPLVGTLMADMGADVIKVEPPRGDDVRRLGAGMHGVSLWWKLVARNKRLLAVDLTRPAGAEVIARLAASMDVLVENFRPGRLAEWGLGYAALAERNPRLIMLHISGYGQTGPYRDRPGFGTLAEAFAGLVHLNGDPDGPPMLPSVPIADNMAALHGVIAVLAALQERSRSGRGQEIELDLVESVLGLMGQAVVAYDQLGEIAQRRGNRSKISVPRNAYPTRDGRWVVLSSTTDSVAQRLFRAIGRPDLADDPTLATNQLRARRADEIDRIVGEWVARHTQTEALSVLQAAEAAAGPINDVAQFADDPHVQARGTLVTLPDEAGRPVRMPGPVARFARTPSVMRFAGNARIGADSVAVLRAHGFDAEEIARLAAEGTIVAGAD
jgi:crotonobetainyl-CoA:carnitine CoA-transferase CaiB-like acyl-CoA transferase